MPRALVSVSDKRGIVPFVQGLVDLGWEVISTGGTAAALKASGVPVIPVDQVTGFPEMLDGRVKTLHPAIHGGILARREVAEHRAAIARHGIGLIDLVAVNLYPFQDTVARPDVIFEDAIENIDIGGPSMLRSAAKNHAQVIPVVDPVDYPAILGMLRGGGVSQEARRELAAKVFAHLADYDSAIARYLTPAQSGLPGRLGIAMERLMPLRYGENPDQRAALYVTEEPRGMRDLAQRHGKELSFNNLLDIDAAMQAVSTWDSRIACCIVKHTTPCGIALGQSAREAFDKARATDPVSAYGGIVAFNTVVTGDAAEAMHDLFLEVVVAPSFHDRAIEVLTQKKALRIVELPVSTGIGTLDYKRVRGGFLVQDKFVLSPEETDWRVPTDRAPSPDEWDALRFAWSAVASVKSNAILLARGEQAIGIGAGQMSRVDSVFMAIHKARQAGHEPQFSVLASDGFLPFADNVELAAQAGITAIIQPGGSVRDADVTAAANRLGLAMVVTGARSFRH